MNSISSVRGHTQIADMLKRQFQNSRLPHSYIFSGPRGIGKKTLALAFAKLANCCSPGLEGDSCGFCKSCICADKGSNQNIICVNLEYQAKILKDEKKKPVYYSIDMVHELVRLLNLKVSEYAWRCVIIDDAELLTADASGALLKTLEEPPENTFFILVVENIQKILPTIISRSHTIMFGGLGLPDFKEVARGLGYEALENDFYRYNGSPGLMSAAKKNEASVEADIIAGFEGSVFDDGKVMEWIDSCANDKDTVKEMLENLLQSFRQKRYFNGDDAIKFERLVRASSLIKNFVNNQLVLTELYLQSKGSNQCQY